MSTLISVNCPVCRRPYVLRVNFDQLRKTRPKALCARCGERFDLLELAEKAMTQADETTQQPGAHRRTRGSVMPKKASAISERTPPPTLVESEAAQPGAYRATVDREAVRRARLRTRSREEIRRALALPEMQSLREQQTVATPPEAAVTDREDSPPLPMVGKEVIADLTQPFTWLDEADPGLEVLASGGPDLTAILESLLIPDPHETPVSRTPSEGTDKHS